MPDRERPERGRPQLTEEQFLGWQYEIGGETHEIINGPVPGLFLRNQETGEVRRFISPVKLDIYLNNRGAEAKRKSPEKEDTSQEQEKEKLIEAVVKEGNIAYHARLQHGFDFVLEENRKVRQWVPSFDGAFFLHSRNGFQGNELIDHDINEAFTVMPTYARGRRELKMSDIYKGGSEEEAYSIVYHAYEGAARRTRIWIETSNRGGQVLDVDITVPKSLALKAFSMVEADPKFARKLVEKAVLGRKVISLEDWFRGIKRRRPEAGETEEERNYCPLRPPYERWAEAGEPTQIYIVPPEVRDDINNVGFHPEFVRDLKSATGKERAEEKPKKEAIKEEELKEQPHEFRNSKEQLRYMAGKARPGDRFRLTSPRGKVFDDMYYDKTLLDYIFVQYPEDVGKRGGEVSGHRLSINGYWKIEPYDKR